jgi:cytoskeletal protein CcmA (bactofilin family)
MGRAMLLLVSGLVILSGIIQYSNNRRAEILPQETNEYYYEQQAKNISTSLVDNAIQNLFRDMEWTGSIDADDNFSGDGKLRMYNMGTSGLDTVDNSVLEWDQYKVLIVSEGNYGGYESEIEVLLQRDSFSKFSYFTNEERLPNSNTQIFFSTGDVLTGPIHSNGTFSMAGSPTFNGDVSSPNDWVGQSGDYNGDTSEERHGSDTPEFNGTANFDMATPRNLPGQTQIDDLKAAANSGGITFNSDAELEFYVSDDVGYVRETETEWQQECQWVGYWNCYWVQVVVSSTSYTLSDYNGLISVDGIAKVKGEVKGKVTLHASQKIEIMGDIIYNQNPTADPNIVSSDLMGLVSEGDVVVDKYAHQDNGSSDLNIHASIMALDNAFTVEDYWTGGNRGVLNILGGIIQKNRGPVGTFNSYGTASGFSKNYIYDERLLETIPPSFPRESIFTIVYWKEKTSS